MNMLVNAIDLSLLDTLINVVRFNHAALQVYECYFKGEMVVTLGFEVEKEDVSAVPLALAYMLFSLGLLGEKPLIVGYSYHNWHDTRPENRGQSITLSNRSFLYEDNTPCTTIIWTRFVDGRARVIIQVEGFPETWKNINDHDNKAAMTPVGRSRYVYEVDQFGGFLLTERQYERLEESNEHSGTVDRHVVRATIKNDPKMGLSYFLVVNRMSNIHGDYNKRTDKCLTIEKMHRMQISGEAPQGWDYLIEGSEEDTELFAESLIQSLSRKWCDANYWIR